MCPVPIVHGVFVCHGTNAHTTQQRIGKPGKLGRFETFRNSTRSSAAVPEAICPVPFFPSDKDAIEQKKQVLWREQKL